MCKARVLPSWRHLRRCFPFCFYDRPTINPVFRCFRAQNWNTKLMNQLSTIILSISLFQLGPSKSGLFNLISFVWRTSNLADSGMADRLCRGLRLVPCKMRCYNSYSQWNALATCNFCMFANCWGVQKPPRKSWIPMSSWNWSAQNTKTLLDVHARVRQIVQLHTQTTSAARGWEVEKQIIIVFPSCCAFDKSK